MSKLTTLLLVLYAAAWGQSPASLLPLTHTTAGWTARNTTGATLTALVYRIGTGPLVPGAAVIYDMCEASLEPGAMFELPVRATVPHVAIAAVVYADGHTAGSAVTAAGDDLVAQVFRDRAQEAALWREWAQAAAADTLAALSPKLASDATRGSIGSDNTQHSSVARAIKSFLAMRAAEPEAQVLTELRAYIAAQVDALSQCAVRRAI